MEIYNRFRNVPDEAKKQITGGRLKGFTDINPMWRIKMLTESFGMCGEGWYYKVTDKRLEKGANGEIAAFVDIELFVKIKREISVKVENEGGYMDDGAEMISEWSMPIFGTGGSMFVSNERNGAYTSDEAFKMALTDAISIACKSLGMGADVYFDKDRTKYDQSTVEPKTNQEPVVSEKKQETLTDMEQVKLALESFTTSAQVAKYWKDNADMHSNQEFVTLVTNRGKELKGAENEKK